MVEHLRNSYCVLLGLNSILLINRHIQQDKDIYGTGSDRKLTAYINHLLFFLSPLKYEKELEQIIARTPFVMH